MAKKKLPTTIPRNGLVGEWLLDGNALDTNDGTKNNGTATNVTYSNTTIGYQKQQAIFNGTNAFIEGIYSLRGQTSWTLVANINTNDISNFRSIYSLYYNCSAGQEVWQLRIDNTGKLNLTDLVGTNTYSNTTLSIGKNYQIVLQRLNSNTFNLYINGQLDKSFTQTINGNSVSLTTEGSSPRIGKGGSFGQFFNGSIQSIRIYNRVLSQNEIQNLYQEGLRMLGAGSDNILASAVAYYVFE